MEIVYDDDGLRSAMDELAGFGSLGREGGLSAERPVLIDRFLEDATEVDVDAIRDRTGEVLIGGVMEHVEEAGVHSGDSACAIPPYSLSDETIAVLEAHTRAIAEALDVVGLVNVQYAVKGNQVFVIEANPRASRTVPFVAKATSVPLVKVAARVMVGATLAELRDEGLLPEPVGGHVAVKEAVLPFNRFPTPTRCSAPRCARPARSWASTAPSGSRSPRARWRRATGCRRAAWCSSRWPTATRRPRSKAASKFVDLGFTIAATVGTADALEAQRHPGRDRGRQARRAGAPGVDAVDLIASGKVDLVVNSPRGRGARADGDHIRSAAAVHSIPCLTTAAAGIAAAEGIADWAHHELRVRSLQEYHRGATDQLELDL